MRNTSTESLDCAPTSVHWFRCSLLKNSVRSSRWPNYKVGPFECATLEYDSRSSPTLSCWTTTTDNTRERKTRTCENSDGEGREREREATKGQVSVMSCSWRHWRQW